MTPLRADLAINPAVAESAKLASEVFGSNLRLSFIGGSHADRRAKQHSDVDIFIVLHRPDHPVEHEFATSFRELHTTYNLDFGHYGEIFNTTTLANLISYTEAFLEIAPDIQNSGCYHGDCIASVFRKGDVVLKFLQDPKIYVQGDYEFLYNLQARATAFFARHRMRRKQLEKGHLVPPTDPQAAAALRYWTDLMAEPEQVDSPLGIGLERWFSVSPLGLADASAAPPGRALFPHASHKRRTCALMIWDDRTRQGVAVRHQCLACRFAGEGLL